MWAWLLLGLAVLLAAGAVVAIVVAGGEDTAVVNTHTAEAGEPALISVPGFAYEDLTGGELALYREDAVAEYMSTNEAARSDYPELGDFYIGWSGHTAVAADGEVAILQLASVNEEFLDTGVSTEDDWVDVMAGGLAGRGATVTTESISGQKVAYAEANGRHAYLWYHDGVIAVAGGPDGGDVRAFVEAYLETAHELAAQT